MTDLGADVVSCVSHATQQKLRILLEKVSQLAQQKNIGFKVCSLQTDNGDATALHRPSSLTVFQSVLSCNRLLLFGVEL